jgi:2OG-Fe(II) oxygenase superfamily
MQAHRDNHRIAIEDSAFAGALWYRTGLCHLCASLEYHGRSSVGLNANLRIYRYNAGQRFGKHIDESVALGEDQITGYTLLVYLNGSEGKSSTVTGGETLFYGQRGQKVHAVKPKAGMALLHLHGEDECLEHEGAEVTAGTKYILRSDVAFKCVKQP